MTQEGHSKEVYALTFQDDGALVASGLVPPQLAKCMADPPVVSTQLGVYGIREREERQWY